MVGIPCKIVTKTLNIELGIYVRVLVEVDLAKLLSERILVTRRRGGQNTKNFVEVSYEKLPDLCKFCGFIGHQFSDCRKNYRQSYQVEGAN